MEFLEYVIVNREFRYIHVFEIHGHGDSYTVKMDGNLVEGSFGKEMTGEHKVDIYAYETE